MTAIQTYAAGLRSAIPALIAGAKALEGFAEALEKLQKEVAYWKLRAGK